MANEAQIQKIRDALGQLDQTNKDHWTEDGSPRTAIVQRMANDQTITRKDIQDAAPNFFRPGQSVDPLTGDPIELTGDDKPADVHSVATAAVDQPTSEEDFRAKLENDVDAAQVRLDAARRKVNDGNREIAEAMAALNTARTEMMRQFPPMTAEQNIKAHIESENVKRAAAVGAYGVYGQNAPPASQLDAAMQRGNTRGWRRPQRTLLGTAPASGT